MQTSYNFRKRAVPNDFDMAEVYDIGTGTEDTSVKKRPVKQPDEDQDASEDLDDSEDAEYDPDDSDDPAAGTNPADLLAAIMNKADPSTAENKTEKISRWMKLVPIHKKRVIMPVANTIYDRVHAIPSVSDILLSNMPLGEKCTLVEKIEILDALDVGTEEYFNMKKDIFRRISNYRALSTPNTKLESLYKSLHDMPTISSVVDSKAPASEKLILLRKLEELYQDTPGTESFFTVKQDIERKLESYHKMIESADDIEAMDNKLTNMSVVQQYPLRMRIIKSDISERNRAVVMEKLKFLEMLPTSDSTYGKLHEWIERALLISDTVIPLEITDTKSQYLASVKQYLDARLYGMNSSKERLLELLAMRISNINSKDMSLAIYGPPGVGKCLHPNTQVLMYLGGMKSAKEIVRGDILMGDDSQPRIVLSTTTGSECMYKITPEYSEPFIVNEPHVLTLYNEFTEHTSDLPLCDYLKKSDTWKAKHKMFCVPVEYTRVNTKNDPYLVGVLLNSKSNTVDEVVKEYLTSRLDNLASYVSGMSDIRTLNISTIDKNEISYLLNHRYIPDAYLYNSRENRYKLLKGFVEVTRDRKVVTEQQRSKSLERTPNSAGSRRSSVSGTSNKSGKSGTRVRRSITPKPTRTSILRSNLRQPSSGKQLSSTPDSSRYNSPSSHSRSATPKSAKDKLHVQSSRAASKERPVTKSKVGLTKFMSDIILKPTVGISHLDVREIPKVKNKAVKPSAKKSLNTRINKKKSLAIDTTTKPTGNISEPSDSDGSPLSHGTVQRQSRAKQFKERLTVINGKDTKLTIKDKLLGEQIKFLARSLGFKTMYIADEIWICDDIDVLPSITRKIETNFHVTQLVTSDYCGFTLDGNGRFILSSLLVTHNTHLVKVYADAIKQPFVKINMGGSTDAHHFLGHSYTYEGSSPGVIVKALSEMKDEKSNRCRSGIVFLDEFDKIGIGSRVAHTFLHISDPIQQNDFQDQYMPEIKIDLSNVTFVYSMNNPATVDPTLLNRLPIIELSGYDKNEKKLILTNFILPEALKNINMNPGDISFTDAAISKIISVTDIEDRKGIRKGKHVISNIVAKINALTCAPAGMFSYSIKNFSIPIKVTEQTLDTLKVLPAVDSLPVQYSMYM